MLITDERYTFARSRLVAWRARDRAPFAMADVLESAVRMPGKRSTVDDALRSLAHDSVLWTIVPACLAARVSTLERSLRYYEIVAFGRSVAWSVERSRAQEDHVPADAYTEKKYCCTNQILVVPTKLFR